MADDDERPTTGRAPLPRHERVWRHPSEVGQQRRANSRRPAPPLGPFVTLLLGVLGLGVLACLVALVMPREAPREALPVARNAAIATPATDLPTGSAFATIDGDRFVLAVGDEVDGYFVTIGNGGTTTVEFGGRSIPLRVVEFHDDLDISILRADEQLEVPSRFSTSAATPTVGSRVTVGSNKTLDASIGVSVVFDAATFVPLAGEVLAADVPEAAPVNDSEGRLVGLFTNRDGAKGFVPVTAINEILSRLQ